MKDTMEDIGNAKHVLKKHTFLHLLMVMVGEADVGDSDDDIEDDDGAVSISENSESTMGTAVMDDMMLGAGQMPRMRSKLAATREVRASPTPD